MKYLLKYLYLLVLLLFAHGAHAQAPSKVLKQAEKALGGSKALQNVRSSVKTGTIKRLSDGAEGRYVVQASQPNLLNINFDLAGFEVESGYNGRSAWSRNSRDGLQTLTGAAGVGLIAKSAYKNNLWLKAKDEKSKLTSGGQASVEGKPANIVLLTNQKGVTVKLFFDAASGLLVRDEIPSGDQAETTDYADYRDVGGVKMAYFEQTKMGGDAYEIRFADVKTNSQIAASEFNFPVMSGEPLPDIPTLLKDLQANEDRIDDLLEHYSYTQKAIDRELGKDGVLRETGSETVQISFLKGKRITRRVEKNGKPLSEKDQAEEDKNAAKRAEEIDKKAAKEEAKTGANGAPSQEGRRISIAEVLKASKLINPRRERFRGREVIVFDFEPNPDYDLSKARSMIKFFGKTAGVMWIDEKDKQVARIEAVLASSISMGGGVLAKLQKGATFTLDKERVGDEIWLPSQADINLALRVFLVKGINVNQLVKYYDYRKFETEVKDATVKP